MTLLLWPAQTQFASSASMEARNRVRQSGSGSDAESRASLHVALLALRPERRDRA